MIKLTIPVEHPLAEIDKTINDYGEVVYQIYYQQYTAYGDPLVGDFDLKPQIYWTNNLLKNHYESFDTFEEALNTIKKYNYRLSKVNEDV